MICVLKLAYLDSAWLTQCNISINTTTIFGQSIVVAVLTEAISTNIIFFVTTASPCLYNAHMCTFTQFTLLFGELDQLFCDPVCWWWPKVTPFLAYLAKLGMKWLLLTSLLRSQSHTYGRMKFLLLFLQAGISPSWAQAQGIQGSNFPLVIYSQGHFTREIEDPWPLYSNISCWSKRPWPFKFTPHWKVKA